MAPSPERRKKIRKAASRVPLILIPMVLLIAILIYTKLYGFKRALVELVDSSTNGQYALSIEGTVVHLRTLSFQFEGVTIMRTPKALPGGIRSVHIPSFDLQFGSFSSLFTEEFNIRKLEVEEPEIEFEPSPRSSAENTMISQQIMELYPAIESVLTRFNIERLKINRASLALNQKSRPAIRINLVDLLIEHWRMRDLNSKSQLKLTIEEQNISLGNASMTFSGIEYNFLQHQLIFNDFKVSTADSVSGSDVEVYGKRLLLKALNFKDFYDNMRYSLQRAEIDDPVIQARFKVRKTKHREFDRQLITRMLKHTLGECMVDSALIRNARIHLELQKDRDTMRIDLPDVDFKLHAFEVANSKETFELGALQVNLNGSELSLSKTLSVKLDEVAFDTHGDLVLRNVVLYSPGARQPIATLSMLEVRYFNLMSLIFNSQINARSIRAEGGTLNVGLLKKGSKRTPRDTTYNIGKMFVTSVILKDIDVNFSDEQRQVSIEDVSVRATNVRHGENELIEYNLKSIHAKRARFRQPSRQIQVTAEEIAFNGKKLNVGRIFALKDSLSIRLREVDAETRTANAEDYQHWRYLQVKEIDVSGVLPAKNQREKVKATSSPLLDELIVGSLRAQLKSAKNQVAFSGKKIHGYRLHFDSKGPVLKSLTGELSGVEMRNEKMSAHAAQVFLSYPQTFRLTKFSLSAGNIQISADAVRVLTRETDDGNLDIRRIVGSPLTLVVGGEQLLHSDSVIAIGFRREETKPHFESIEIFQPVIQMPVNKTGQQKRTIDLAEINAMMPGQLKMHPGSITLQNGRVLHVGNVVTSKRAGTVRISSLETSFHRSELQLRDLELRKDRLSMDSLMLISNKSWYARNQIEESQMDATFHRLKIEGFNLDDLINHQTAENLRVEMDHVGLDIFRDKRLEDPPIKVKPSTLDGMIPLPEGMGISRIVINDGRVEYHHISDKTSDEGFVLLDKLSADAEFDSLSAFISLKAKTSLYNSGTVDIDYKTLDARSFRMNLRIADMDLTKLNQIIMPLQAMRIKSGYLKEYNMNIHANEDKASGQSSITYKGLHLEILKRGEPDKKSFGSEVLTLLADGIILKHSKEQAKAEVNHQRVKHKSIFHYWVTSAVHGAMGAIRKGKRR